MTRLHNKKLQLQDEIREREEELKDVEGEMWAYRRQCEHKWTEPKKYVDKYDGYYQETKRYVWWQRVCTECGAHQTTETFRNGAPVFKEGL